MGEPLNEWEILLSQLFHNLHRLRRFYQLNDDNSVQWVNLDENEAVSIITNIYCAYCDCVDYAGDFIRSPREGQPDGDPPAESGQADAHNKEST